ncbi:hypothetical protein PC113_g24154 [Phytophthora cactorum]|uniref:ABC-2 type transporter transmembrane domain-containing protein n=1 Tax=Phytophthora cactorum TaxID=29920 RepID=A0A8T0Y554_9STRA|nr:hypothetical protein PC113_g24154 [Phytophthora cactorum]
MPNEKVANVAVGALSCLFNLFSGFLLPRTAMKPGYKWFQYVMPSYYSLSALAGIQFGDNQDILTVTTKGVASNMTVAAFVKKTYDFHPERKYDFMAGLLVIWAVLQLAIYLTFKYGIRGPHASPLPNKSPFHAIHQGRSQDRWRADTAPEVQQRGNYIVLTPIRRSVS